MRVAWTNGPEELVIKPFLVLNGHGYSLLAMIQAAAVVDGSRLSAVSTQQSVVVSETRQWYPKPPQTTETADELNRRPRAQLYRKGVWKDAKTVNVVAGALTCP